MAVSPKTSTNPYSIKSTFFNNRISVFQRDSKLMNKLQTFRELLGKYEVEENYNKIDDEQEWERQGKGMSKNEKLQRLENQMAINKAQQELNKRTGSQKKKMNIRKHKNWKKIDSGLNKPYLEVYQDFMKNYPDQDSSDNTSEHQTQQQFEMKDKIAYANQISKYSLILSYTQDKIKKKQKQKLINTRQKIRAKSLEEVKKNSNDQIIKDYQQVSKVAEIREKAKMKDKQHLCKVNKALHKKFKKKEDAGNLNTSLESQSYRLHKFRMKQNKILSDKSRELSSESITKIEFKFAEIRKSIDKNKRVSQSARCHKPQNSSKTSPNFYRRNRTQA